MHRDRFDLWQSLLQGAGARTVLELGVWEGEFARQMLEHCPAITRYYMLDPWRPLQQWNKPLNLPARDMDLAHRKAIGAVAFAGDCAVILRGTTTEVIDSIGDGSLDAVYIDGDHTARGITIDLVRVWPKVRPGGIVGGDDFVPCVWQHDRRYEPTFVSPLAIYFAEAMEAEITAMPFNQFVIRKPQSRGKFRFVDQTGRFGDTSVRAALRCDSPSLLRNAFWRLRAMSR